MLVYKHFKIKELCYYNAWSLRLAVLLLKTSIHPRHAFGMRRGVSQVTAALLTEPDGDLSVMPQALPVELAHIVTPPPDGDVHVPLPQVLHGQRPLPPLRDRLQHQLVGRLNPGLQVLSWSLQAWWFYNFFVYLSRISINLSLDSIAITGLTRSTSSHIL